MVEIYGNDRSGRLVDDGVPYSSIVIEELLNLLTGFTIDWNR